MSTTTPPGWYDDGQTPGQLRYWDGTQWTGQFRPVEPVQPAPPAIPSAPAAPAAPLQQPYPAAQPYPAQYQQPHPGQAPRRKVSVWAWLIPLIVVVLAGIGVGVWLIVSFVLNATAGPREAIARFDQAFDSHDCALLQSVSTERLRADLSLDGDDCNFDPSYDEPDYAIDVVSIEVTGGTAAALTREQWTDADGARYDEQFRYDFVQSNGAWLIDQYQPVDGDVSPVP